MCGRRASAVVAVLNEIGGARAALQLVEAADRNAPARFVLVAPAGGSRGGGGGTMFSLFGGRGGGGSAAQVEQARPPAASAGRCRLMPTPAWRPLLAALCRERLPVSKRRRRHALCSFNNGSSRSGGSAVQVKQAPPRPKQAPPCHVPCCLAARVRTSSQGLAQRQRRRMRSG